VARNALTNGMLAHLRYALYVARHKYFVFVAGLRTGAPLWRLVIHDWSKLTQAEWGPYVRKFYGGEDTSEVSAAFDRAWLHHQHHNPHHWQHWVLQEDEGETNPLPMPEPLVREMVADWMGAGRAITGRWEVGDWYRRNRDVVRLEPRTRRLVRELIAQVEEDDR
jgi:hypothetical protein